MPPSQLSPPFWAMIDATSPTHGGVVPRPNPPLRRQVSLSIDAERPTPQQERDLVIAAAAGDADASLKLVEAFLPPITGLARRFPTGVGLELEELVQEGVTGLLLAAQRYDSGIGRPFWAYASFWVRKAMQELVAELARPVALSDHAVRGLARIKTARREHLQTHGVEPTIEELSRDTGLAFAHLNSLQAIERTPRSLEDRASAAGGATATVGDTITDPAAELAFEQVLDDIEIREARQCADQLDERERTVIRGHFGLGQPAKTLKQIGGALGLTAERARQIELGALNKLREALARRALARGKRFEVPIRRVRRSRRGLARPPNGHQRDLWVDRHWSPWNRGSDPCPTTRRRRAFLS
jgi:RNA polymerase primary sigma factor